MAEVILRGMALVSVAHGEKCLVVGSEGFFRLVEGLGDFFEVIEEGFGSRGLGVELLTDGPGRFNHEHESPLHVIDELGGILLARSGGVRLGTMRYRRTLD